ncbi:MAG: copper amine oxidase N-terminal domain-containing protein [Lachnospiraceae bacterium]|nr:copper amine oxidase N-terminal domain-containing protein [Lachnospiraceae bacterium]
MKKRIFSLLLVVAMVFSLNTFAFAEESTAKTSATRPDSFIAVQLNGEYLIFPDMKPEFKNDTTYMPLRAFLEALGAEASYNNATGIVTATKDDLKIESRIGSTRVMVTENGKAKIVETSSAPYISNGRTMIPVRYASEIFGFNVGYDNSEKTVVIIDTSKIADSFTDSFTLINKYMALSKKIIGEKKAFNGTMDIAITDKITEGSPVIKATGTFDSVISQTKADMNVTLNFDEKALAAVMSEESEESQKLILDVLSNLKMNLLMDINEGTYYYQYPSVAPLMGYSSNTWFKLDMNSLLEASGISMSMQSLVSLNNEGFENLMGKAFSCSTPTSVNDYKDMLAAVSMIETMLGDSAFRKVGDNYLSTYETTYKGTDIAISIKLLMDSSNVNGYEISATVKDSSSLSLSLTSKLDSKLNSTLDMTFGVPDVMDMSLNMNAQYSDTTKTPTGKPADGSEIIDLASILLGTTTQY